MKTIVRARLVSFACSLALLSACGGSDNKGAGGGGAGGTPTTGTGGTAGAGTGGTQDAGSGTGGSSDSGTADTASGGAGGTPTGGTGGSATTTMNIKATEGGTIAAEGLMVKIPAGALMADTDITVAVSDGAGLPAAATLVGKVYDLGPNGTTFLKPVSVTISFDATKVVAPKVATVAFLDAGAWVPLAGSFTTDTKASAPTMHFTHFGVVITDPVINNCVGMAKAACKTCCETTFASGKNKVIPSILQTCGCVSGSPCNAQCGSNACMGMTITADCQTCMSAEGAKQTSVCFNEGLIACQTMSDCKSYVTCAGNCQ